MMTIRSEALRAAVEKKRARKLALSQLVRVKVVARQKDAPKLFDMVKRLCLGMLPGLEPWDVPKPYQPVKWQPIYEVSAPARHVDVVLKLAKALYDVGN